MTLNSSAGIRVLVVEDEVRVSEFIKKGLINSGMVVETVEGLDQIEGCCLNSEFDVLVLDRMLRMSDSIFSIHLIKKRYPKLKILLLSALGDVQHRIRGLELGADDYLPKPFHIAELEARIHSLARRTSDCSAEKILQTHELRVDDLVIDLESQKVVRGGESIELSSKEFKVLVILANQPERLFSRAELLNRVWSMSFDPESNVVDVTVGRLKRKLNLMGLPQFIVAKRGAGYSLRGAHEGS